LESALWQDYRVIINDRTVLLGGGEYWDYGEKFGVAKFSKSQLLFQETTSSHAKCEGDGSTFGENFRTNFSFLQ